MAGLSTISGLVAGFDTKAAVKELVSVEQYRIDKLKGLQESETAKQNDFASLSNMLLNFRNTAAAMADKGSFFSYTADLSSSNPVVSPASVIDVSGGSSVNAGSHTVVVQQLAQAQRNASTSAVLDFSGAATASDQSALGLSGSFTLEGISISVNAADSIQDIASSINQQNTGASATGVTASVMKVSASDYRLILQADQTGATGYTLTGADLTGTLSSLGMAAGGQTLQAAQDAIVDVDGLGITRTSNVINDVLTGINLTLKQADPATTITLGVNVDTAALRDGVQLFVDSYNEIKDFINAQYKFDEKTGERGLLAGEALIGSVQSSMANSLLTSVPNLANDRNSLVMIGVEPDVTGRLMINDNRFLTYLNSDPGAIRDVFVASGNSNNQQLDFLVHGANTPSGIYAVNVTQEATRALVTGTTDLNAVPLAQNQTVTLTQTSDGRQAIVNLIAGQTQLGIISTLNTELTADYTEEHYLSGSLQTATGFATASTRLGDLVDGVGASLNVGAGDTITIGGNNRGGASVSSTFTIIDPALDTVADLFSAIQTAFSQQAVASIDLNGNIRLTEAQSGDSLLNFTMTAKNESGATLNFGADTVATEGRYPLGLEAIIVGNAVQIQHQSFGDNSFSVSQSFDGLGMANQTLTAFDIAGNINGETTTGKGQMLIGGAGNIDGMAVFYTGATTGYIGDVTMGMGASARLEGVFDTFANPVTGLLQNRIERSQNDFTSLGQKVADMERQLQQKMFTLSKSFSSMESAMSSLNTSGDYLTKQIDAMNAP
ncbi:MAG: flagellar filament capping protein FliD [Ghiorsea sp.]